MGLGIKVPKGVFAAGRQKLAQGDDFNQVELEPGRYTCILKKGRAVEASGKASIVMDLEVAGEAEQAGGRISVWFSLEEERIVWLFRALALLGYEVEELDESRLEEVLKDIENTTPVVRVTAKKNGEYTNYRMDKLLPELSAADVRKGKEANERGETGYDPEAGAVTAGRKNDKATPTKTAKAPESEEDAPKRANDEDEVEPGEDAPHLTREEMKAYIKSKGLEIKVMKSMSDEDIRSAITAAESEKEEPEEEGEAPAKEESDVEVSVGMSVVATVGEKQIPSVVKKVNSKDNTVTVVSNKTKKEYTVAPECLTAA